MDKIFKKWIRWNKYADGRTRDGVPQNPSTEPKEFPMKRHVWVEHFPLEHKNSEEGDRDRDKIFKRWIRWNKYADGRTLDGVSQNPSTEPKEILDEKARGGSNGFISITTIVKRAKGNIRFEELEKEYSENRELVAKVWKNVADLISEKTDFIAFAH
ncbi:hypothetical protein CEXT_794301 [Caerostris extrusa]|uniref:Uncharacterized protein n=1 Tax=Caerostris extrusa TaxID=172846 RepID=A0AAV4Y2G1_CAEEX|nr:hypothetical protein CEXT_794301 [Caerostris extrusa]